MRKDTRKKLQQAQHRSLTLLLSRDQSRCGETFSHVVKDTLGIVRDMYYRGKVTARIRASFPNFVRGYENRVGTVARLVERSFAGEGAAPDPAVSATAVAEQLLREIRHLPDTPEWRDLILFEWASALAEISAGVTSRKAEIPRKLVTRLKGRRIPYMNCAPFFLIRISCNVRELHPKPDLRRLKSSGAPRWIAIYMDTTSNKVQYLSLAA